jgi:hypothetical protein
MSSIVFRSCMLLGFESGTVFTCVHFTADGAKFDSRADAFAMYGVISVLLLCARAAAFFHCAFFPSTVSALYTPIACLSEALDSVRFWCVISQLFQNIPMWTSLFGLDSRSAATELPI